MFPHARTRAGVITLLAAAVALTATGCLYPPVNPYAPWPGYQLPPANAGQQPASPSRPVTAFADKSAAPVPDNRTGTLEPVQHQQPAAAPVGQPAGPTQVVPPPAAPNAAKPPPGSAPLPMPQPLAADPHTRGTPTNAGAALGLGPNEMPIDRAVELSRRIDGFGFENQRMADRIKALEAKAEEREQAINETVRDAEIAATEVMRTKAEVRAVRKEIDALRERVKTMEKEEVETLRKVIDALEKLLQSGEQP